MTPNALGRGIAHINERMTEALGGVVTLTYNDGRNNVSSVDLPAQIGTKSRAYEAQQINDFGESNASNVARETTTATIPARFLVDDLPIEARDVVTINGDVYDITRVERRYCQNVCVDVVLSLERQ